MSNAIHALGTLVQIGDGATPIENFLTIAEVGSISGPSLASEPIDVTNQSSGVFREFINGLRDGGELTFDVNYQPTTPTHSTTGGLPGILIAGTKKNYRLVFPDGPATKWTFQGIITAFEISAAVDDRLTASVTIKLTAQPTFS